ncbi:MAG TPA: sulfatase-like hydrolase/transferase, partial [Verrucomicrobiae bacterium]|nr:sulfatase-like hydrolase/transferase [Verrucomicrobiae bacterium]
MDSSTSLNSSVSEIWNRSLAALLICLACLVTGLANAAETTRPPNIVFILVDDLGWADLACNGSKSYKTPNIDRLAREGARFSQAYTAAPICSPTRASILTGRSPARLHMTDWLPGRGDKPDQKLKRPAILNALPLEEVTLAETLKVAGYATAHIGKWHLGGEGFSPLEQG